MEFCQEIHKEDFKKNDIVIGSLLGDASIDKNGRIEIFHSVKQKEYTLWLMNLYSKYFKVHYKERICKNKLINKEYPQVGFRTSATDYTKLVRMFFYCPQKTVNMKQLKKLSPLGIAIWYMDDGCLSFMKNKNGDIRGRQIILNTQGFSYKENEIIVEYFKETWGIEWNICKDKDKFRLWLNGTQGKKFINIIKEYIPECMYYKICYRYFGYKSSENLCIKECCKSNCPYNIV